MSSPEGEIGHLSSLVAEAPTETPATPIGDAKQPVITKSCSWGPKVIADQKCEFQRKLEKGSVSDITVPDIKEVFRIGRVMKSQASPESSEKEVSGTFSNGQEESATIVWSDFCNLLQEILVITEPELAAITERANLDDDCVTADEIFRLLQLSSISMLIKQVVQDSKTVGRLSRAGSKVINKKYLTDKMLWRASRDDSFGTLPVTLLYMIVFMILVIQHLQIWNRQEMERGMEQWIEGYGNELIGPYLKSDIQDVGTYWYWLEMSGIKAILGNVRKNPRKESGLPYVKIASTNYLVGDIKLTRRENDKEYDEWLLNSEHGKEHLKAGGTYLNAGLAKVKNLKESTWAGDDTSLFLLTFTSYNQRRRMYLTTDIKVPITEFGMVIPTVTATAVKFIAYPENWVIVFDGLYVLLILFPLYIELKDMISRCRHDCGSFADYWQMWNIVDWCAIVTGFVNIGCWITACMLMQEDCLHRHLEGGKLNNAAVPRLSADESQEMHEAVLALSRVFYWLHISVALTTISIVLKFFKAFQANARLQVVTKTLTQAAEDIAHFFVVFGTIFFSFATIGHVLFGSDLVQFYTIASSINTGVTTLMGDFGWYVELSGTDDFLPSGTPRFFLTVWFIVYMFFVLLVLLNILLALIISHYTIVEESVKGSEPGGAPTLWVQAKNYFKDIWATRNFVPRAKLLIDLDDDDSENFKDDDVVTEEYLMHKLAGVKEAQAKRIMDELHVHAQHDEEKEHGDETTERMRRTEEFVRRIAEELHIVTLGISDCGSKLNDMEDKLNDLVACEEPQTSRTDRSTDRSTV